MKKRAALLACVAALLGVAPAIAAAAETAPQAAETEGTPPTPDLTTLPAEGPGSVVTEGENVVVEAHFEGGAAAATAELEAAGATVLETSVRYQTVSLSVAPEDLEALTEVPGLEAVEPSLEPVFYGAEELEEERAEEGEESGPGSLTGPNTSVTSNGLCEGGSVVSQAMTQLHVAAARGVFGARGAGQTIGVISDSFNAATEAIGGGAVPTHAHEDEVSNDLPGPASTCSGQQVPVRVVAEGPAGSTDEGRAMLQVIHDLAPHAALAFATAYSTELEFAKNIERLAAPVGAGGGGANVIVDDVGYFAEPFYQDGPVAVAIQKVTQEGVTYLTAAGNDNLIEAGTGNEFASWERERFDDAQCPPRVAETVGEGASHCLNFSPTTTDDTTFGITVEPESQLIVDLQWAEPWYGVESDLNAYLLDAAGNVVLSETVRNGTSGSGVRRQPLALFGWENASPFAAEMQLVIDRCIGNCNTSARIKAKPRVKFILMEDGAGVSRTEYPESEAEAGITVGPTIYGHAGAPAAITLAAVGYAQSATAPVEPERYSSRGPVTHYYGPVSGTVPASKLLSPEAIQKPNVTATDCASTTFFASLRSDGWHFCGTSQAAPHAAAIAALMRQTQPLATPSSIGAKLESSAIPFTKVTAPAAGGAGMVNAEAAIAAIGGTPVSDPPSTVTGPIEVAPTETRTAATPGGTGSTTPTKSSGKSSSSGSNGDKSKPKVKIARHPKALERTRRTSVVGRFRFSADQNGVTFYCQVDKAARRVCGERFKRRFGIGSHVVKVRAVDSSDGSSSAPASFRFRVQQVGR